METSPTLIKRCELIDQCLSIRTEKGRKAISFRELADATIDQMEKFLNHPYIKKLKNAK